MRRRGRAAARNREQQWQKYDNGADAGALGVLFVLDRLDAEIAALELRARRQLARCRLGCDLAGDHDQLALRERCRDGEVLFDQENVQALLHELPECLDQALDDRGGKPFGRLIHDQQLRVRQQRTTDREHLLLPARELRAAVPLPLGQAWKELVDPLWSPSPPAVLTQALKRPAAKFTSTGIPTPVPADQTTTFTANVVIDGTISACSEPFTYREDSTDPQTTIDSGPSGSTADATPTFAFSSSEPGSSFQCRFDSAAFGPCSGPGNTHTPANDLATGSHVFEVRATDAAQNTDASPASQSFTVAGAENPSIVPRGSTGRRGM